MASEIATLKRRLRKQGFSIKHGKRHMQVSRGGEFVTIPNTPSEYRGLRNCVAQLKKIGYQPKRRSTR